jgi:group I intron endonuclease
VRIDAGPYPKAGGVYRITNTITGDFYIGSAVNLINRANRHAWDLAHGQAKNPRLQASWNKYGADAFAFRALCVLERPMILQAEQALLDAHCGQDACVNAARSASAPMLGRPWSEESRRKASESAKRRGITPEQRERMRLGSIGIKRSPEHIAKIAAAKVGRKHTAAALAKMSAAQKGRTFSDETRAKMADAKRGRKQSPEHVEARAARRRGATQSEEWKAMMRERFTGRSYSPETIQRMRDGQQRRFAKRAAGG